jgi:hypothetical protein
VANKENERETDGMIYEGLGTGMTDIGVATKCISRGNDTLSAGPDMNKTARAGLNMNRPVDNKIKRLGIDETLATGLAKEINNDNKCASVMKNIVVDNPKAKKAPKKIQTTGQNVAKLALGLATKLNIGPSATEVILNGAKCVKSMTGSPKAKTLKAKKNNSKIALPDWLKKWQTIAAESPPPQKKLMITQTPPNTKNQTLE